MDEYIKIFLRKKESFKTFLLNSSNNFKTKAEKITIKGKKKIELEKSKIDLKKKCYELGVYTSENNKKGTFDFSYDDKFQDLIDNITVIKTYISNLSNDKINI